MHQSIPVFQFEQKKDRSFRGNQSVARDNTNHNVARVTIDCVMVPTLPLFKSEKPVTLEEIYTKDCVDCVALRCFSVCERLSIHSYFCCTLRRVFYQTDLSMCVCGLACIGKYMIYR